MEKVTHVQREKQCAGWWYIQVSAPQDQASYQLFLATQGFSLFKTHFYFLFCLLMHWGNITLVLKLQEFLFLNSQRVTVADKLSDLSVPCNLRTQQLSPACQVARSIRWLLSRCVPCSHPTQPFPTLPVLFIRAGKNNRNRLSGYSLSSYSCWPSLILGNTFIQL